MYGISPTKCATSVYFLRADTVKVRSTSETSIIARMAISLNFRIDLRQAQTIALSQVKLY